MKKSIVATAMMATAMSMGIEKSPSLKNFFVYERRRDKLPEDVQNEKIRKAEEKRKRKALKDNR